MSVPTLSIILPALGRLQAMEDTLVSVLTNRPPDCEVLVVVSLPYADPYQLDGEVRFVQAPASSNWVDCVNLGVRHSQAAIVHVLECGAAVCEGWTNAPLSRFADSRVAAVCPAIVSNSEQRRVLALGLGYRLGGAIRTLASRNLSSIAPRTLAQIVAPSPVAGFYRRSALETLDGLHASLSGTCALVDAGLQWRELGYTNVVEPASTIAAAGESLESPHGSPFHRALSHERLFLRNVPQGRWAAALVAHAWMVAWELVTSLPRPAALTQLLGRAVAWTGVKKLRRHRKRLQSLPEMAAPQSSPSKGDATTVQRATKAPARVA